MAPFVVYEFAFVCCSIAAVALLIWDHVITFGREVQIFWSRKISGPAILYGLLRYGTLFEKIAVMLLASWYMTPHGCNVAVRFQIFPMILRSLGYGMFSALRVYALRRNQWPLAIFVFLLCLPSLVMPAYVYAHQWSPGVNVFGCTLAYKASPVEHTRCYTHDTIPHLIEIGTVRIAGLVADLLGEFIVIIVTINRTFHLRKQAIPLEEEKKRPGLMHLFLRDGSVYFVALLILSLADMLVLVFDHVPSFATRYDYWVVPYYTPVFRTIIISRFLLMLRSIYYDESNDKTDADGEAPLGSLKFQSRVIGTMGAPVDSQFDEYSGPEPWEDEDDLVFSSDPLAAGLLETDTPSHDSSDNIGKESTPSEADASNIEA
ncbi:hypothetical protein JR316_0007268 [Psilocybe cubensis]|uniref:DUF6533 domain-containing protein n=2 Tax=Psilocybe cubensis TaxID=181762 RepID=A0A8H7XT82_PSICU|nr:hypothetical protein JR316_0007268 [Psilocybe cubensis]KAH9480668.1 hypothetical protein JR316_0007268 [Psilocybe cubensis]